MKNKINVLSLFNGMSCGRLALERTNLNVNKYYSSEVDPYAIIVADSNYPRDIPYKLGSVVSIDTEKLDKIDLLIGGSPCQGFSFAGKMLGTLTECNIEIISLKQYLKLKEEGFQFKGQSYLFWEYIRILNELKIKNPNIKFLLENVNMHKKWQELISETIGVEPLFIDSKLVSAQSRKRLYWTNIPNISVPIDKNIFIKDIMETNVDPKYNIGNRIGVSINGQTALEKLRVSQRGINEKFRCLTAGGQGGTNSGATTIKEEGKVLRLPTEIEVERAQTVPDNFTCFVSKTQRYKMLGNGWTIDVIAHILRGLEKNP